MVITMNNSKQKNIENHMSIFHIIIGKTLITALLVICLLILFKKNSKFESYFKETYLSTNFNFAYVNNLYQKYLGSPIPFVDELITQSVFQEKISYEGYEVYLDGVSLSVKDDYLVPAIKDGLVIYIGEKEGYGNTVIVKDSDGVDVWYSNLKNINVKMYEYVNSNSTIGECSKKLYLVFKKDGEYLDFKKFI